jgi:acetyl-CoA carboxylase carboxyl transferase subunit beta
VAKYVTVQVTRREPSAPVAPVEVTGPQCKKCRHGLQDGELEKNLHVCPYCGYHYPMPAHSRISLLADSGSVRFIADELRPADPLEFFDLRPYLERYSEAQKETGLTEAMLASLCTISGRPAALGVMDFKFMGGSMGSVLGERFFRLAQAAIAERRAFVIVASSGGARMQEGLFSLMQMAKTVTAVRLVGEAALPYITILTHPTTGGVFASFATVADIIIAEPGAIMQFAGSRIIEQTTREKLPPDFGTSEKQLTQGQVDMVVHRPDLKDRLARCLEFLGGGDRDGRA